MINQELKKKIINTLGTYEKKIDALEMEIDVLKGALNQLVIEPLSINLELKDPVHQLGETLNTKFEPMDVEKKVTELSSILSSIQHQESENQKAVSTLLKQGADSLKKIVNNAQDVKSIEKFQKTIDAEEETRRSLMYFNELISQCVASVMKELEGAENTKRPGGKVNVSTKVNERLYELLNHLTISQELDVKKEHIKGCLENNLNLENLCTLIDDLTGLVIDSFNLEQNRFKQFLQKLTDQLQDLDAYLKTSSASQKKASSERKKLEEGIEENMVQIQTHIDNSSTIEELSSKISKNFENIGQRLKEFKEIERKREKEYEKLVKKLRDKLAESEKTTDEVKHLLSFQKYRINHDSLTGLPNRESYEEHIAEAIQRWKRSGKHLSLAIADIDFFKQINDNYGHLAGDKVLKKVALIFRASIRGVDFIARIGGEEFIIIFEQTPKESAQMVLEKLRKLIEECQFYYREEKVNVTVSFGLTSIQEDDDIESLFIRADKALYKAKSAGRNRVEVF